MLLQITGWISQVAFCICTAPLAYQAYKDKQIYISLWFMILWTVGEVMGIVYAVQLNELPMLLNYCVNSLFLAIVWRYRCAKRNLQEKM